MNKNSEMGPIEKNIKVIPFYSDDIGLPNYCNFVQVKFTSNEYLFDFGFVDPQDVDVNSEEIAANIVSRVCMNHQVAREFLKVFQENIEKFEKIADKIVKKRSTNATNV